MIVFEIIWMERCRKLGLNKLIDCLIELNSGDHLCHALENVWKNRSTETLLNKCRVFWNLSSRHYDLRHILRIKQNLNIIEISCAIIQGNGLLLLLLRKSESIQVKLSNHSYWLVNPPPHFFNAHKLMSTSVADVTAGKYFYPHPTGTCHRVMAISESWRTCSFFFFK